MSENDHPTEAGEPHPDDQGPPSGDLDPAGPAGEGDAAAAAGGQNETVGAGKPSKTAIAEAFGTSLAYVSKCIRDLGCPDDSIEAAMRWRSDRAARGAGYRSKGGGGAENPTGKESQAGKTRKLKLLKTPEASLAAAIEVESRAKFLVDVAFDKEWDEKLPPRIAAYNKAKEGRDASEKRYQAYLVETKVLVPFDDANAFLGKVIGLLFSRLRAVPKRSAHEANPAEPLVAEAVMARELEGVIGEVRRTYGAIPIPE